MIDAAIIGLGRWGKGIVQSVQGRSKRLRFIRGVSKEPEQVRDFAATHGFALSTEFADAIADPSRAGRGAGDAAFAACRPDRRGRGGGQAGVVREAARADA